MRIERTFVTPETPDVVRTRIADYLAQAGYQATGPGTVLRFQRGSARGSTTGSPPQAALAKVVVEVRTGYDQRTWVCAIATIQLGAFARKDPAFWQQEMDGLVTSVGGEEVHLGTAATQSLAPAFILHQPGAADSSAQADSRVRSGANWFYWIAGMSIVNTVAYRLGLEITFLIGLVGTVFVEGVGIGLARALPDHTNLVMGLALVAEILVAGIFVVLGALARKGLRWAFILGLVFYVLDAIIWLLFGDYLPAAFHLLGLYGIFSGLRALGRTTPTAPVV